MAAVNAKVPKATPTVQVKSVPRVVGKERGMEAKKVAVKVTRKVGVEQPTKWHQEWRRQCDPRRKHE